MCWVWLRLLFSYSGFVWRLMLVYWLAPLVGLLLICDVLALNCCFRVSGGEFLVSLLLGLKFDVCVLVALGVVGLLFMC